MTVNLKKMEIEKNNFIRKLSKEQFDAVVTNKYKKVFFEYFDGKISDSELAEKINKNLELVSVYESGDNGKIDSNQYLYSAIVEVALNYYNVANGFETCINKMNLLASYFQLSAIAESKMNYLLDLIYDAFFINANFDGSDADRLLKVKLEKIKDAVVSLDGILAEISKHENVISDVEKESGIGFVDEIHMDESIKEMYVMFKDSANETNTGLNRLKEQCADVMTDAKLDIINGTITGGA